MENNYTKDTGVSELNNNASIQSVSYENLKHKKYSHKESVFTNIFNIPKCRILYNLVIALFIVLLVSTFLEGYILHGKINLGLRCLIYGMGNFQYVFPIWTFQYLFSLLCHPAFSLWAKLNCKILDKSIYYNRLYNIFSVYLLVFYYLSMLVVPTVAVFYFNLAPISSVVILIEEVRILMKLHSYIRNNVPVVFKYKPHEDYPFLPPFENFLYFMFAPTFLYQNEYPRIEKINWSYVSKCFFEMGFLIILMSLILDKFIVKFEVTCIEKKSWAELLLQIWQNSFWGMVFLAIAAYTILHCWLNAFAEMMRFADRAFYKDWWNTPSYLQFYRLWNDIVQDWLFVYVYKDFYEIIIPGKRTWTKVIVFFISAVFHEYILGLSFRFFFPVNFCFFFFGSLLMMYIKRDYGNIYFLSTLGFGFSLQISLYCIEFYAHQNCPVDNPSFMDLITPRIISCNCVS